VLTPSSPRLAFTRDGHVLLSVEDEDAITLVDTRSSAVRRAGRTSDRRHGFADQI
jgi:hypothetical protein